MFRELLKDKAQSEPPCFDLQCELIGRDTEISLLQNKIERLSKAGRGGIIWVTGDAGIGKSRLVDEVKNQQKDDSIYWSEGRALSYCQTVSYWPFLDILKQFAGITEEDDEVRGWQKLQDRMSSLFPDEVADTLPYIATLLTFEVKGNLTERVAFLNGDALRRQIFKSARDFVSRLAQEQPLVLEFEDFQWTDESTVELIQHLLPLIREYAVILCFVTRPELQEYITAIKEEISDNYGDWHTEIALAPLEQEQSLQMVCRLLGLDDISPQVKDIINIKSQGNPLFVEELIRSLLSSDLAFRDKKTGKWRMVPIEGKVPIPDTLRGLIAASIDRLDEDLKDVLKVASVIGRNFLYRLLKEIQEAHNEIDTYLQLLVKDNLIHEKTRVPELEYTFKHDLIKESAYESILLEKRREIHKRVAEAIEQVFQDHRGKFYGLLAYHYAQASLWEKAHEYLLKTANQADRMAADAEALANYKKALAAYDKRFGTKWDPAQRAILERKMGESFFRKGDHLQAIEYLQRALSLHGRPLPAARWSIRLAIVRQLFIQVLHRLVFCFFLHRVPDQKDPHDEELLHIYEMMAWIDFFMNRERLLFHSIQGLNYAEQKGYRSGMARGFMGLGVTFDMIGSYAIAALYHRRAMALIPHFSNPVDIGHCYLGLALHEDFAGHWEKAAENYSKAAELFWKSGDMRRWGNPAIMSAFLLNYKGEFQLSLELSRKVTQIGEQCGDRQLAGWGKQGQGLSRFHSGNLEEAQAYFETALELLKTVSDHYVYGLTDKDLAKCFLQQGNFDQALEILENTNEKFSEHGLRGQFVAFLRNALAEAHLRAADHTKIHKKISLNKEVVKACKAAVKESKRFCWAQPEAYRLTGTCFWLQGNPSAARKYWNLSLESAEKLGAVHDYKMTCSELEKRIGADCADLKRSEAILQEMQGNIDLSNIHKMMQIGG